MKLIFLRASAIVFVLLFFAATTEKGCSGPQVPMIAKEQLRQLLNDPDIVIIDLRINRDWNASDQKIPGAVHEDPDHLEDWAKKYPKDTKIVLYCA
jgi:rhodanese-related sulfurtransferase